ncbi:MAG: hypothetical protein QF664_11240 [Dehalococcoidia bacterium]|jgi:hypothetical protein|nr:hypothetical protein [Dehalococcoidia bacterium]
MKTRIRRLRPFAALTLTSLALLAIACGGGGDDGDSWSPRAIAVDQDAPVVPVLFTSQISVGPNRIAFGLFDRDGALLSELAASVRIFAVEEDAGTLVSAHELERVEMRPSTTHEHADGELHPHASEPIAVFVTTAEFARPGDWGAEVTAELAGETTVVRMLFTVLERTTEPMLGERIPGSVQRVLRDVDDIAEIDSSLPPEPRMHEVTVAEALEDGLPAVIVIATPAFCQSRFCGPVVDEVVRPLEERHRGAATFIHIEPFDLAEARGGRLVVLPVMAEWGLMTEPWIFVVDREGRLAAKFEGVTSAAEVEAALLAVLE